MKRIAQLRLAKLITREVLTTVVVLKKKGRPKWAAFLLPSSA
jgi:hypothetical protein